MYRKNDTDEAIVSINMSKRVSAWWSCQRTI